VNLSARMSTAMLASVSSIAEARLVAEHGADIVDLKDPSRGALGALDRGTVRAIVRALDRKLPVSATVGDLLGMQPEQLRSAAARMAQTGVDIVKIGFFAAPSAAECISALGAEARQGVKLVAVLFADCRPQWSWLPRFAEQRWHGVMLDTAAKDGRSLRDHLADEQLAAFVAAAQRLGLVAGLAGSLRSDDIADLLPLNCDYLGFRGALCGAASRSAQIDPAAFMRIRAAIPLRSARTERSGADHSTI
jgi:uncharacterized protein (UPF0264 family)